MEHTGASEWFWSCLFLWHASRDPGFRCRPFHIKGCARTRGGVLYKSSRESMGTGEISKTDSCVVVPGEPTSPGPSFGMHIAALNLSCKSKPSNQRPRQQGGHPFDHIHARNHLALMVCPSSLAVCGYCEASVGISTSTEDRYAEPSRLAL